MNTQRLLSGRPPLRNAEGKIMVLCNTGLVAVAVLELMMITMG